MEGRVKIQLRHPRWEEMKHVRRLWEDPATMEAVGGVYRMEEDEARRWFEKVVDPGDGSHCYFLVFDEKGEAVGEVSSHRMDSETRVAEFNIKVLASHRGRGIGTEAMRQFFRHYFLELDAAGIDDPLAPANREGRRLLERFGFVHDPAVEDVAMMRLNRKRYLELHGPKEA